MASCTPMAPMKTAIKEYILQYLSKFLSMEFKQTLLLLLKSLARNCDRNSIILAVKLIVLN